jgi:chitodextrinase
LRATLNVRGLPKVGAVVRFGVHLRSTDPHHRGIHVRSASLDFGDQTVPVKGVTATHTYAHPGDYLVVATVTDQAGRTTAAAKLLHVTP